MLPTHREHLSVRHRNRIGSLRHCTPIEQSVNRNAPCLAISLFNSWDDWFGSSRIWDLDVPVFESVDDLRGSGPAFSPERGATEQSPGRRHVSGNQVPASGTSLLHLSASLTRKPSGNSSPSIGGTPLPFHGVAEITVRQDILLAMLHAPCGSISAAPV
jgi:hypothetical protein